jgi:uncharacterized protein (TIGR02996 family)
MLDGFLSDIVAHPEEHRLWLILADWLEDQDDPRAELVRLTWALQYESEHPEFGARQTRVQALLAGGMQPVRPTQTLGPGMEFAWIPPGSFWMGSPLEEAERGDDETQHPVKLTRGFWMGVTPVTQGQWLAVKGNNPSWFSRNGLGKDVVREVSDTDLAHFPVESVCWYDAQVTCEKLSKQVNKTIRLPTEAEWEYACRAGTRTPFHFGPIADGTLANLDGRVPYEQTMPGPYLGRLTPVGNYAPNPWGLLDCHGQVCEWCQDEYTERYEKLIDSDPCYVLTGQSRVLRGGSWNDAPTYCRASSRNFNGPAVCNCDFGLRVCYTHSE